MDLDVAGRPLSPGESSPRADSRGADPNYFKAAGIPVLLGRTFASTDAPNEDSVVVINKLLADRLFPNVSPIGKRIAWAGIVRTLYPDLAKWRTVVGVVGNTRDGSLEAAPQPVVFAPLLGGTTSGGLVIRTTGDPSALTAAATRIVRRIAPTALIENVMTIQQFKDRSISPQRLNAMLISSFGALALVLAALGIAGVLAFSVSARTNEIGIRMSLGADSARVERMILREGGTLVLIGLLLGVTGALLAGRVIQGLLFGIAPNDPATLISAGLVMAAIGMAACWIPALRAARVDPIMAMRAQ
jgi:predicted permease